MSIIKLKHLLESVLRETTPQMDYETPPSKAGNDAADQAHKLGLTSVGWGRWKDQSGKIVAKTIGGHLVKTDDNDGQQSDHEYSHSMDTDNAPDYDDAEKTSRWDTDHAYRDALSSTAYQRAPKVTPDKLYPGYKHANVQGQEPHVNPYDSGPDSPINQGVPYSPSTNTSFGTGPDGDEAWKRANRQPAMPWKDGMDNQGNPLPSNTFKRK